VVVSHGGARRSFGKESSKSVRGTSAALRNLLWLAAILALYYIEDHGSLQMTRLAIDLDKFHSALHVSVYLASLCRPGCCLEDQLLQTQ
jgi:hypothetical protein